MATEVAPATNWSFPNGGETYVVGNIIQQADTTENPHLVSFGVEGYSWPASALYMVNNTLLSEKKAGGVFLRVSKGARAALVVNNVLHGQATFDIGLAAIFHSNPEAQRADFADMDAGDWRLTANSRLLGRAVDPGEANGVSLRPVREYRHPAQSAPTTGSALQPGALQSVAKLQ